MCGPQAFVYCSECKERVNVDDTNFIDISEDMQGADLLTFECHFCETENQSRIYS